MAPGSRWFVAVMALMMVACSSGAEMAPLLDPNDFLPAVLPPTFGELTHSQQETQQLMGGLELTEAGRNPEEEALRSAVVDLKKRVESAVEMAYQNDPALLLSDSYQEKAHEWVMTKHHKEFSESLTFARTRGREEQKKLSDAVRLIDMILFQELASDPKLFPLFASFYDAAGEMAKTNKAMLGRLYSYDRNDKLIGYSAEPATKPITALPDYLRELEKRYPSLISKLQEVKREVAIPDDAFAGITFGELYRLLDGIAQMAVELRTPKEVQDLRQELRSRVIQLANLRNKLKKGEQ